MLGVRLGGQQTIHPVRWCPWGANPVGGKNANRGDWALPPKIYHPFDDSKIPDENYFKELERVTKNRIIWGGNYFLDFLGATPCMIFWDKCREGLNFADGEIAWTSFKTPTRRYTFRWNGMLQGDMKEKENRVHPTQKPIALYMWLLDNFAKDGDKILDTHVGSASSLIACHRTGHDFVGFEKDDYYYNEAKKRLDDELAQTTIFDFLND